MAVFVRESCARLARRCFSPFVLVLDPPENLLRGRASSRSLTSLFFSLVRSEPNPSSGLSLLLPRDF